MLKKILEYIADKTTICFECSTVTEKIELLAFLNVAKLEVDAISKSLYENDDEALFVRIMHDSRSDELKTANGLIVKIDLYVPYTKIENVGCCSLFFYYEDFKFECSWLA